MSQNMLAAALALAAAGWSLHPCVPSGPRAKAPLLAHGHHEATTDPDQIRRWWTRWPDAMSGAAVPETLIVFDIDPRNGGFLEALEDVLGPLPTTLTAWSGRGDGGHHLYYQRPPGEIVSTRLPPGIDLKRNGYTVVPPSLHPATMLAYRWESAEPVALPWRAVQALRAPLRTPYRGTGTMSDSGMQRKAAALIRTVADACDGNRNDALYWASRRALEENQPPEVLDRLALGAISAGLPVTDVERTVDSAKAGHAQSGAA